MLLIDGDEVGPTVNKKWGEGRMVYDTLVRTIGKTGIYPRTALFGCTNIGNIPMSNMHVGGAFPFDYGFSFERAKVVLKFDDPRLEELVRRALYFTLVIGDRNQWNCLAKTEEIVFDHAFDCPPMQSFRVELEWFKLRGDPTHPYRDAGPEAMDVLQMVNEYEGSKLIMVELYGRTYETSLNPEVVSIDGTVISGSSTTAGMEAEKMARHLLARQRVLDAMKTYASIRYEIEAAVEAATKAGDEALAEAWRGRLTRIADVQGIVTGLRGELE